MKKILLLFWFVFCYSILAFNSNAQTYTMEGGMRSITTCGGVFYDDGGENGNYTANMNGTLTFYPSTPGHAVQLVFTHFLLEDCCDYFSIYNGNSQSSPIIVDQVNGSNTPNGGLPIISNALDGSLTINFTSDPSVQASGWEALISCVPFCSGVIDNLVINLSLNQGVSNQLVTASTDFIEQGGISYQWQLSSNMNGPWRSVSNANQSTSSFTVPQVSGTYFYRLQVTCLVTNDISYSNIESFTVVPTFPVNSGISTVATCSGLLTDNGLSLNYSDNFNGVLTIVPTDPSLAVSLTFTEFGTRLDEDVLSIYDGSSINDPVLIENHSGVDFLPNMGAAIIATGFDGSLTIQFHSNDYLNESGWIATIGCVQNMNPICDATIFLGATILSASSGDLGTLFNAIVTDFPQAQGVVYHWQSSTSFDGPWSNVPNAITANTTLSAAYVGERFYRLQAFCLSTSTDVVSTPQSFTATSNFVMPIDGAVSIYACDIDFYDSGNSFGNYGNVEDAIVTFYPDNLTGAVVLSFDMFELEGCCDYFYVYNGNSIDAPVLVDGVYGYDTPNQGQPILSTAADGSLTIRFTSDGSATYPGWVANVSCVEACTGPVEAEINLSFNSGLPNTTFVVSTESPQSSGILYQWQSSTSESGPWVNIEGATYYTNVLQADRNTSVTYYRLQFTCTTTNDVTYSSNVDSFRVVNSVVMGEAGTNVQSCNGVFTDPGGSNDYPDSYNRYFTIAPTDPSMSVTVQFTHFSTEEDIDFLSIYDGSTINTNPLFIELSGDMLPNGGQVISSSSVDGSLTFSFSSDFSVTYSGWEAVIGCVVNPNPLCDATIDAGTTVLSARIGGAGTSFGATTTAVIESANISYQWQSALRSDGPWIDVPGATLQSCQIVASLTDAVTYYRLQMTCNGSGTVVYSTSVPFSLVDMVNMPSTGSDTYTTCSMMFYDSGGFADDYLADNEGVITFYPEGNTQVILTFSSLALEMGYDELFIYDGNSVDAPVLFDGGYDLPTVGIPITSSAADGSLTIQFFSDGSAQYEGWAASVTCVCIQQFVDVTDTICPSLLPYMFGDEPLTETGVYTRIETLLSGCDNTINLSLVVETEEESFLTVRSCETNYVWDVNGQSYNSSGMYTAITPGANGCDNVINMNLILTPTNRGVVRDNMMLTAVQQNASYQWVNCDNDFAPIANASLASFTPTARGIYACEITLNNCTITTDCINMMDLSIFDVDGGMVRVYPNPTSNKFTLSVTNPLNNEMVEVYNTLGQMIYSGIHSGNEIVIDLTEFPVGIYVVKLEEKLNLRVVKF